MTQRGPDVDGLVEAFPMVDRSKLEKIRSQMDALTLRTAAEVLDEAKQMGKVPQENYAQLAAAASEHEQLDIAADDPLDEPPDADPASPHNASRGQQAINHIKNADYPDRAHEAAQHGRVGDMIDLLNTGNKWANEALLDPNTTSLPTGAKKASELLGDAIVGRIDALAAQGKTSDLRAAKEAVVRLNNATLRQKLGEEVSNKLRLLENEGTGYADARERVLDEGNTPKEVQSLYQDAIRNSDITYQQAQELGRDVTAWLEEYRDVAAQQQAD